MRREDTVRASLALFTFLVFIWATMTSAIQGRVLGVVFLALVIWSLYPERHFESSVLVIILLATFQASLDWSVFIDTLFSTYGGSGLWIIISGFVLAKGMESSGLARRIALWIATSLGGDPNRVVLSVAIANLAVAPLSPSTTAKAFLLLPICTALVEAFGVEKGHSRFGAAVMLMAMAANNICSTAFLTATVPNPISMAYIQDAADLSLGWVGWLRMALPVTLVLLAASYLVCVRMFRPEVSRTAESLEGFRRLRDEIGPMDRGEKVVALFFSAALLLWITDGLHPYNAGLVSLALSLVLFAPSLDVMKVGGFAGEVPWGSITLFAASMFLAKAIGNYRALEPVATVILRLLNLSGLEQTLFVSLVVVFSMFLHVAFTSTTVYATVVVPLAVSLGRLRGLSVSLMALPVAYLTPIAVILPVNTLPNIVFYKAGYFSQKQIVAYGLVTSLVCAVLILIVGLPYWGMLGLT